MTRTLPGQAYILCGGQGTRLRSVITDGQKALVDIHGRPFLALVLEQLRAASIGRAILCAGHRSDLVADALPSLAAASGLELRLAAEDIPLGTGGAILYGLQQYPSDDRYLVLNADTFLEAGAYRLAFEAEGNVLVAARVADRSRFGSLVCAPDGRMLKMLEKGPGGPGLVNGGVYVFAPETLTGWPLTPCSMERDILPTLIQEGRLRAVEYTGAFRDIGTPESLEAFKSETRP